MADYFVKVDERSEKNIKRFVELLFGSPFCTPTVDEMSMYEASAIALRSADLSRQVGAVVVSEHGSVIAKGCNEVPWPSGGAFWPEKSDEKDNRDYTKNRDFNAIKNSEIVREFIEILDNFGFVKYDDKSADIDSIVHNLLNGNMKSEYKDARISNLIDFGRVVHAEMHAICDAAARGVPVKDATLFCTTFPCHMCAKHIIASGIERVVYIEPYPKSLTGELYDVEITLESRDRSADILKDAVAFDAFAGVAPRMFQTLFSMRLRKDGTGYVIDWDKKAAQPRPMTLSASHLLPEAIIANELSAISRIGDLEDVDARG